MPLQATSGAASYDAFGGGVPVSVNYIEDVFSTYLYKGTGVAQTITNGIDVSTKGGLVWIKCRNVAGESHVLADSARGASRALRTNASDAEVNDAGRVSAFTTSGFSIGTDGELNGNGNTHVSWTFRKQPKFFDVVTWTGLGANRTIAHNLGSVPACIIVKRTDASASWSVYHRSLANTQYLTLNTNDDVSTDTTTWNSTTATSTVFSLGTDTRVNASGGTYVAYIFAHDAGGFGLTGTDNVISCGSFTTGTGFGASNVNLGWEPQWVLIKRTDGFRDWVIYDTMRGFNTRNLTGDADASALYPNLSSAEDLNGYVGPYATGFSSVYTGTASANYIYIAIRRGPMKVPTSGTSVFNTIVRAGTGTATSVTGAGFPPDFMISHSTNVGSNNVAANDKLRGPLQFMATNTTGAESTVANALVSLDQDGFSVGTLAGGPYNVSGQTNAAWMFRRAPSFFDEVCYTGTGSATTVTHNLGVVPEMIIVKPRSVTSNWQVFHKDLNALGTETPDDSRIRLNSDAAATANNVIWNSTLPTSTVFSVGASSDSNGSGNTLVAYLFATCAGVSKVFSYTGNGSSQTINCGFTSSARFVLIKRTDDVGDWYVWDTARGIVSGNDSHLSLNTADAEVTTDDTIDTDSTGFVVNQVSATNVNVSSATYIGLAIA